MNLKKIFDSSLDFNSIIIEFEVIIGSGLF